MSNTKRPKWTAAQVDAGNAEQLLGELAGTVAAEKDPVTRSMLLQAWDVLDGQGRADEFPALAEKFRADAARKVIGGRFLADLMADGLDPGLVALAEQRLMGLGTGSGRTPTGT